MFGMAHGLKQLRSMLRERRCRACHAVHFPLQTVSQENALAGMLCPACVPSLLRFTASSCPLCGLPATEPDAPRAPCGACLTTPPPWDALGFYALYEGPLQHLLLRFKFGQEFSLLPPLGIMLTLAAADLPPYDAVVPVPRHPRRLRDKGFNQSHELARHAAALTGIPLNWNALRRTRLTRPQIRLSAAERRVNPKGSFAAQGVEGLRLLLVDDVMTTGATLRHAAQALLDAGAASARVAVVARAAVNER